jgi:hypothetical protein
VVIFPVIESLKRIDKKILVVTTAVFSVVFLAVPASFLNSIISIGIRIGGTRYATYLIEGESASIGVNIIGFIIRWTFVILYLCAMKTIEYEQKHVILTTSCIAIIIGSLNAGIFIRLVEYYMIGIYISIVKAQYMFTPGIRKIYRIAVYIAFMIILIRNLHSVSAGTYMVYELYPFQ